MKNLILIGGGGHCKSVIDVAEAAGYTILGILDKPSEVGKKVLAYEVIGSDADMGKYADKAEFIVSVGQIKSPELRIKLHQMLADAGCQLATIISPIAHVSKYATVGEGTVVMHQAVVNADARIGKGCIINTMADIEHDVRIGDFCHISTAAVVNGEVKVGNDVFIGSRTVVHNCKTITNDIIIAAGSVVTQNLDKSGIYAGNPAKYYGI